MMQQINLNGKLELMPVVNSMAENWPYALEQYYTDMERQALSLMLITGIIVLIAVIVL
jgi:hypothetical protein